MTVHSTATPWAHLEVIEGQLRAIVDGQRFNGSITVHFAAGTPIKVERSSVHSDRDGWSFALMDPAPSA